MSSNCGGQNINCRVVTFLMSLFKIGLFPKSTLLFLVYGRTKNVCDRLFSVLKLGYHNRIMYTYYKLLSVINENEYINTVKIEGEEMLDFLSWQDKND